MGGNAENLYMLRNNCLENFSLKQQLVLSKQNSRDPATAGLFLKIKFKYKLPPTSA